MSYQEIKIYSSRILDDKEFINFSFAFNQVEFYKNLIEELSTIHSNVDDDNISTNKLIEKYTEQKNKYLQYIDICKEDFSFTTGYHLNCIEKLNVSNDPPHTIEIILKNISPNVKYNFRVCFDQFGYAVPDNFYDIHEIEMINKFEEVCLNLVNSEDKLIYNMIELGSNQSYYSLLFHKILLSKLKIPKNIMVESTYEFLQRGVKNFEINRCIGKFYNYIIGNIETIKNIPALRELNEFGIKLTTLSNIMLQENINFLDILHCDIDYAEYDMLMTSQEIFVNKQIDYIFLATHGAELHQKCKQFLLDCGYNLIFEHDDIENPIGWDTLLILKS